MKFTCSILLLHLWALGICQEADSAFFSRKSKAVFVTETSLATGSYAALYSLWYKGYDKSSFHFFDDSKEWAQMDKLGHSYSSYWISAINTELFTWSGLPRKRAAVIGSGISFAYMAVIEVFDGYSEKWGASVYDILANTSGSLLFAGQELLLGKQICRMKYSYWESGYALQRPNVLGKSWNEKLLKDYNGQTYWLSLNISSVLKNEYIPEWLNIAAGHSINGFTGGHSNSTEEYKSTIPEPQRVRQFLISLDVDLSKIKTRYKTLNAILYTVNCIKIPTPTLELREGELHSHLIYF